MKIQYLGTAAAEGVPALFCECETCRRAREMGGKEIRTRSQALIDGKLMIDFPADTLLHTLVHHINLPDIHHYLITHIHGDHLYPIDFAMLRPGFSHLTDDSALYHVYGSEDLTEQMAKAKELVGERLQVHILKPFETYEIAGYKVTPLKANHGTPHPFVYIIAKDGKRMLYNHDSGIFADETWDYLVKSKPYFDFISWDCTEGQKKKLPYPAHLCMGYVTDLSERLKKNGMIDNRTVQCVNHFSHNGEGILYAEREKYNKQGYFMSYDGMEIEF